MTKFSNLDKDIKEQWLKRTLDPSNDCYNLRSFIYNVFGVILESNQYYPLRDMLDPKIRRVYISMARQAGKTFAIGLFQALVPIFFADVNCYVFAPKKEQAEISFEKFSTFVHFNPVNAFQGTITMDKADRIKFYNNVENRAITASRNAEIEGLTAHIIILDESQAISPYKVRESILPMGGGVDGGAKIIQVGVPGIIGSHFHKAYKNKYDPKDSRLGYIHHIYPWKQCPRLIKNRDYVLAQKADDPDAFARNYELKWQASNFGLFIPEETFESCLQVIDWESIMLTPNIPLFMGVDFAKLRDSTVITLGYTDPKTKNIHIIYWYELQGTNYNTQAGFIKDLCSQHYIQHILVDKSSIGEAMVDFMREMGLPVTGANFDIRNKDKMYKHFRAEIQKGRVKWPSNLVGSKTNASIDKWFRRFMQQMLELEVEYKSNGLISVHHNLDDNTAHDDYPDSVCLLVWGISNYIEPKVSLW